MIFFKGITYPRITFSIHYIPERSLFLFSMLCSSIRYYILLTLSYISIKRFSSCDFSFAYSLFIYTLLYLFKFHGHFPQFSDRPNKDLSRIPNKFIHVLLPQGINCRWFIILLLSTTIQSKPTKPCIENSFKCARNSLTLNV